MKFLSYTNNSIMNVHTKFQFNLNTESFQINQKQMRFFRSSATVLLSYVKFLATPIQKFIASKQQQIKSPNFNHILVTSQAMVTPNLSN